MSIRVMTKVWEGAPVSGGKLLILLALADFSNDDGESWPSIATLGTKARLGERQTQNALKELEDEGLLHRRVQAGPHGVNRYIIQTENCGGANTAGVQKSAEGVQFPAQGVQPTAPEPSVEPSVEPSAAREAEISRNTDYTAVQRSQFPLSQGIDALREPDAVVERWLIKWAVEKYGEKAVLKGLKAYGDSFFLWRKVQGAEPATLKQGLADAMVECEAELAEIRAEAVA